MAHDVAAVGAGAVAAPHVGGGLPDHCGEVAGIVDEVRALEEAAGMVVTKHKRMIYYHLMM